MPRGSLLRDNGNGELLISRDETSDLSKPRAFDRLIGDLLDLGEGANAVAAELAKDQIPILFGKVKAIVGAGGAVELDRHAFAPPSAQAARAEFDPALRLAQVHEITSNLDQGQGDYECA
jgi:hypothetical protein